MAMGRLRLSLPGFIPYPELERLIWLWSRAKIHFSSSYGLGFDHAAPDFQESTQFIISANFKTSAKILSNKNTWDIIIS